MFKVIGCRRPFLHHSAPCCVCAHEKVTLCKFFMIEHEHAYTVRVKKRAHAHMSSTHAQVVKCVCECAFFLSLIELVTTLQFA
jgi:hypothetical protein